MKALQHFFHYKSRNFFFTIQGQLNSEAKMLDLAGIQLHARLLCLSKLFSSFITIGNDWIKTKQAMLWTRWNMFFKHSRASNSEPICPELDLVRGFIPVHVICKSHKDLIKTKQAMLRTRSNILSFGTQGQVTPK